jgi:hypothetical protein
MPRGGLRSTSFKPGISGNPGGRPKRPDTIEAKRMVADARALAREVAPEAVEMLKSLMLDTYAPAAVRLGGRKRHLRSGLWEACPGCQSQRQRGAIRSIEAHGFPA